ncbi:MAG: SRPBCC family protein [Candidatus Dormibacteria bacterium]
MIEASATATLPVRAAEAFAVVSDIENADWLPAVRGVRHLGGPATGVGARYEVEAGLVGRHLRGILEVVESVPPKRLELRLEEGLDLTVTIEIRSLRAGSELTVRARYSVGGVLGAAVERASQPAARREAARAVEQLAAHFADAAKAAPRGSRRR